MAIIGDCGYWPYTSGRSVRLYTNGCVVDSSTGLMGPCSMYEILYSCNPLCKEKSEYSLQAGRLIINEGLRYLLGLRKSNSSGDATEPSCLPCPVGAKCEGDIQALPNYWGYRASETSVSLVRCPDGYCCQGNETCVGTDSCNVRRTGTLCGRCQENLTESIFTSKCLPSLSCRSTLVMTLFISAALIYAVVLLSFSEIKKKVMKLLKKVYTICKDRFRRKELKVKCTKTQQTSEDPNTDEIGFKYMQILLYYVQDSRLFTVQMPKIDLKI